jgi:hypothetical protein
LLRRRCPWLSLDLDLFSLSQTFFSLSHTPLSLKPLSTQLPITSFPLSCPLLVGNDIKEEKTRLAFRKLLDIPSPKKPVAEVHSENDAFETNCASLLVKSLYNGNEGLSIDGKYRGSATQMRGIIFTEGTNTKTLKPDFVASVRKAVEPHFPTFARCLVATNSLEYPTLVNESEDLPTPPPSTESSPTKSDTEAAPTLGMGTVIFEWTRDMKLWKDKLTKMEMYIKASEQHFGDPPYLIGLGFRENTKFKAIQDVLGSRKLNNDFPLSAKYHANGRFLYLVCDATFWRQASSDISSHSYEIKSLTRTLNGLVRILAGNFDTDEEDESGGG